MDRSISNIGYWSGLAAFTATLAYDVVQILQIAGILRFPADKILIYGTSFCIVVPFILEMLALHHVEDCRRLGSNFTIDKENGKGARPAH